MEFNKKLQELRKQKGVTQEELAKILFVSRTAISKWESGRGYPNIDSLKAIAAFFEITLDELLSNDELLTLAQEDNKQKENNLCTLVFGLLDVSNIVFLLLPFFGQKSIGTVEEVSLLFLTEISLYLKVCYFAIVIGLIIWGILTLALQNSEHSLWIKIKSKVSLLLTATAIFLFTISLQPYAAIFSLIFLTVKVFMLIKRQ